MLTVRSLIKFSNFKYTRYFEKNEIAVFSEEARLRYRKLYEIKIVIENLNNLTLEFL